MDAQAALEYLTTDSAVNKDSRLKSVSAFTVLQSLLIATADCFKNASLMSNFACQGLEPGLCMY